MNQREDETAIICPHCDWYSFDTVDAIIDGRRGVECKGCGEAFEVEVEYQFTFKTRPRGFQLVGAAINQNYAEAEG